jgi:putative transposase
MAGSHCGAWQHSRRVSHRPVQPEDEDRSKAQDARRALYQAAREHNPARWSGKTRNWRPVGSVWLNPERDDDSKEGQWADDALSQKAGGEGPLAGHKTRAA